MNLVSLSAIVPYTPLVSEDLTQSLIGPRAQRFIFVGRLRLLKGSEWKFVLMRFIFVPINVYYNIIL